jgi:16S rRNA (cytidine1402-2'-O)-methyltransferase
MAATLHVVATPIGNLEDITLRALRVLRDANLILAEDTRRTSRLLRHYGITTPTLSYHEHNERQRLPVILQRLHAGEQLALVTDAGTPAVSDPGANLIRSVRAEGFRVEVVPGASAPVAALVSAGLPAETFTFLGFAPARTPERRRWLQALADEPRTVIFFEAPHRIRRTLQDALEILGNRQIVVARELTKIHEEVISGAIAAVLEGLVEPRGEFTLLLPPSEPAPATASGPSDDDLLHEFGRITEDVAGSRREAIGLLAKRHDLPRRLVYEAIERAKK